MFRSFHSLADYITSLLKINCCIVGLFSNRRSSSEQLDSWIVAFLSHGVILKILDDPGVCTPQTRHLETTILSIHSCDPTIVSAFYLFSIFPSSHFSLSPFLPFSLFLCLSSPREFVRRGNGLGIFGFRYPSPPTAPSEK